MKRLSRILAASRFGVAAALASSILVPSHALAQKLPGATPPPGPFQLPAPAPVPTSAPQQTVKTTIVHSQPTLSPAGVLYNSALNDFKAGRTDAAVAKLRQFSGKYPKDATARGLLGYLELRESQTSPNALVTASRDLGAAVALQPKNVVNRSNYASALLQQKRWADAAVQLRVVAQMQPNDTTTQLRLAGSLGELGRTQEANALYAKIVQSPSCPPFALFQYGITLAQAQKDAAAAKLFDRAAKLEPTNAAAWNDAGICYERAGSDKDAARCLAQAVKLGPTDPYRTRFVYGTALARLGRSADAIQQFRYITTMQPTSQPAWFNLGLVNDRAGHIDDALAAYGQARQLAPNHVPTLLNTCRLLIEKGQTSDAIDILSGASQAQPKVEVLHAALGAAYLQESKPVQTRSEWESALVLDPGDNLTRARLAQLYLNDSEWAKALAEYNVLVKAAPDSDSMLNQRAEALEQLKQYSPAMDDLRRALALNPKNAIAWNNLGTIQEHLSHTADALAAYRKAAALSPTLTEAKTNIGRLTGHPSASPPPIIPGGIVVQPSAPIKAVPATSQPQPVTIPAAVPPATVQPTPSAPSAASSQSTPVVSVPAVPAPQTPGTSGSAANQSSSTPSTASQAVSGSGTIKP